MEPSNNYKREGYIALAFGLFWFIVFSVYFYGGRFGSATYNVMYGSTTPFFLYLLIRLQLLFVKRLKQYAIGLLWLIDLIFILVILFTFTGPHILFEQFGYDVYHNDLLFQQKMDHIHLLIRIPRALVLFLCAIFCFRYKLPMKNTVHFWGFINIAHGIAFFFHSRTSTLVIDLLAAISTVSVAYFFFNFEREMTDHLKGKEERNEHPEVIDQLE